MEVTELLDIFLTSSSDSDEEIEALVQHCLGKETNNNPTPKVKDFMDNVIEQYNEGEFKKHLRVNKNTFNYLVSKFENSDFYKKNENHGGTPITPAKVHIAAFLWFAGNKTVLRVVALLFNTSISTMFHIIERVIKFILSLGPHIIKFPHNQIEQDSISNKFYEISRFPNILGCIDGTYIHIRTPAHKIKSTYVNRHDVTSLTLQGICDSKRTFLDVFTGISSKMHDARVYQLSFIKSKIMNLEEKYHILGDAAYPISFSLLTPYRDYGHLTQMQQVFNKRFSQCRVKIENTFALLKGRFRQLIELDFWRVEKASEFIIACCILHNLCIENNDFLEEVVEEVQENDNNPPVYNNERERLLKRLGEMKRDQLAHDLFYN